MYILQLLQDLDYNSIVTELCDYSAHNSLLVYLDA